MSARGVLGVLKSAAARWSLVWTSLAVLATLYIFMAVLTFIAAQARVEAGLDRRTPIPDQLAAIITTIDAADPVARKELLRALNGSEVAVRILEDWPDARAHGERADAWLGQTIRGYLPPERAYLMDDASIWFPPRRAPQWLITEVQLYVPLTGGEILEISLRDRWIGALSAFWLAGVLGIVGMFLAAGLMLAFRRILAPLSVVAAAADRVGRDGAPAPMPETGPAELRRVARAFNAMSDRVQDLLAQRTRMLAGIAHDLRSVLTRQRLRLESLPDPAARDKAIGDLDFMLRVIDTHLDFAKAEDTLEPPTKFDLAELVRDLAEDFGTDARPTSFTGPRHAVVVGRPDGLRRAVVNLIDNALAYGGCADVSLTLAEDGEAQGTVILAVADRGPGVPAAEREAVFAPYRRNADGPIQTEGPRSVPHVGLGLATTRAVIRRHGGDVAITDRPGGGAVFTARWPSGVGAEG